MEIKRCARCGCFFESINDVCNSCLEKDNKDVGKLKNFLQGSYSGKSYTKEELSSGTGITVKNLNRFLSTPEFNNVNILGSTEVVGEFSGLNSSKISGVSGLSGASSMGEKISGKKGMKSQL